MSTNFIPGWISCLDESMMIWKNNFGPDWLFLLRKPHPFGNNWHTICCAMSVVVFFVELVERKDQTTKIGKPELEADYVATGGDDDVYEKVTIWYSLFCVLKGLVGMLAHVVYGKTVIQKEKYWPKYFRGDAIYSFFQDKEVGDVYDVCGDLDGHKYKIQCMKEADYVMNIYSPLMARCLNVVAKRCAPTKIEVKRQPKYFVILNQWTFIFLTATI